MKETKQDAYWVEFIGDRSVKVEIGQTILDASLKAGIPHYHACGGNGKCSTCRILVHKGKELLSQPSEAEVFLKDSIFFTPDIRLACQTFLEGGPVAVQRIIRDEEDIKLYITGELGDDLDHIGEEKELALFFLDIRNFTAFIEHYLPFDVIHVLRRLFGLYKTIIERHKGRIIETAGDGFYAVFGFETDKATAANQAYDAAKEVLKELEHFNDTYVEKNFNHRFEVGIGIHIGRVIAGNIGMGVNNNITVMGLPVNIASRIQAMTKTANNNFLISETTYLLLAEPPQSQKISTVLKGLKETYNLFLCGRPYQKL